MREFMYEREVAPCGVAVETIYGADEKSAKVWKLFAMQIFSEAESDYREIEHLDNGAPILNGIPQRITLSHTTHCITIGSIPKTPDIDLEQVNPRTAIGIDLEKEDRRQVLKIRDKFLTEKEKQALPTTDNPEQAPEEEVKAHILAWTCKEALYKAAMGEARDWKEDYIIMELPAVAATISEATPEKYGKGRIMLSGDHMDMWLSAWEFEGHIVTLAFSGKIPKFQPSNGERT